MKNLKTYDNFKFIETWEDEDPDIHPEINISHIGKKVRIIPKTEYYGLSILDPKDMDGEITKININRKFPIIVKWDNGKINSYTQKDLMLV